MISCFDDFNIIVIPHSQNLFVDTLTNVASRFTPLNNSFTIKLLFQALCTR
jgi:hypothetical protein